ncbi:putative Protein fantom [Hypsibius exemplaris]|uniref:C2 domain-containing protein n=1 Tax=Hypsibius exemplaris TaxID=2072580 RepID=A0A1W0X829_HYPEX|nr:putative Protein fantom [Hypsibius exemplaris]
MDSTDDRFTRLARTMEDFNQGELEEMARGGAPRGTSENQLHLNVLRRRIQQQRGIVAKLSRDDLEDQYLHALEELEMLKKEGNTKDIYIKKLSTKILRLQRSENFSRPDQRSFSASMTTEMEQKIRGLENQLRMAKVYGSSLPRRGSKITAEPTAAISKTQVDSLRQQLQVLESERREEQDAHRRTVRELQSEIGRVTEKITSDNARTTMLENIEITRLTRQLAKTSQDLSNMKNDYIDIRPKYEELQINKIVVTRENERLKQEIERHQQTIDSIERQLREAREKSLQQIHDHERANRLESEVEWFKRQHQSLRSSESSLGDPTGRSTENVLRLQIKAVEEDLQKELKECQELRKRVTERDLDIEKALRDVSELRAVNLHLKQECDEIQSKYETAVRTEPKTADGWYKAPPGFREQEITEAFRLHESSRNRRSIGTSPDESSPNESVIYRPDPILLDELERSRSERETIQRDLSHARENLKRSEDLVARLQDDHDRLTRELNGTGNRRQADNGMPDQAADEIKELNRLLQEKNRQVFEQTRQLHDLERQLKDVADGSVVYNLEDEVADQSRLSAENVILQHGDNLLQLHFGPFSFNQEFFAQAQALRIKKWRLKWSVFGENMFAQDSEQIRPDFDFTAIHCITMDEEIITDLSEGFIRLEIIGIRNDFSRVFAYASFSCRKLLEDSYQRLNRIRGEVQLVSQFNVGAGFGSMAYWIRMKFDIQQTQAMFFARRKALEYVEDNTDNKNSWLNANQLWLKEAGRNGNLLYIRIHGCRGVRALVGRGPPSPCVLYQFYDAKATFTPTITGTENPNFDHEATFKLRSSDQALDSYLLSTKLDFYVADANDNNKDHFLGCCQVPLAELTRDSITERSFPLVAQDRRQNGSITLSFIWERPYRSIQKPNQGNQENRGNHENRENRGNQENRGNHGNRENQENRGNHGNRENRGNRVSMTPRGSLVSVRHAPKLLKVDSRNNSRNSLKDGESFDGNGYAEDRPRPPPRKSISRPSRTSAVINGDDDFYEGRTNSSRQLVNGDSDGNQILPARWNAETKNGRSNDSDGLESGRRRRSRTVDDRRRSPSIELAEYRSLDRRTTSGPRIGSDGVLRRTSSQTDTPPRRVPELLTSRTGSGTPIESSPRVIGGGSLQRHASENGSLFIKRLVRSDTAEKIRRTTVGDPSNRQTVEVELHSDAAAKESPKTKRTTRFSTFLDGLTRRSSRNSARKPAELVDQNGGIARKTSGGMYGSDSASARSGGPSDSIRVVIHSLYFVEDAGILRDPRPGEIFVIFELLGLDHESPLAVVKSNVPNKVMTFEFEKVFPMEAERESDSRRLIADMLRKTPPGRIPFSVYFQPDDEAMDSELVGVAALSLNRLLTKNQDAIGAELKLVSPSLPGVPVGYMKVTIQAVSVLNDLQKEYSP